MRLETLKFGRLEGVDIKRCFKLMVLKWNQLLTMPNNKAGHALAAWSISPVFKVKPDCASKGSKINISKDSKQCTLLKSWRKRELQSFFDTLGVIEGVQLGRQCVREKLMILQGNQGGCESHRRCKNIPEVLTLDRPHCCAI